MKWSTSKIFIILKLIVSVRQLYNSKHRYVCKYYDFYLGFDVFSYHNKIFNIFKFIEIVISCSNISDYILKKESDSGLIKNVVYQFIKNEE